MKKNTKLTLGVIGVAAIGYYLYKRMNPSISPALATKSYSGEVKDRMGADGVKNKKAFASDNFITKPKLENNNMRYSMTGQPTFFSSQPEKLNY